MNSKIFTVFTACIAHAKKESGNTTAFKVGKITYVTRNKKKKKLISQNFLF